VDQSDTQSRDRNVCLWLNQHNRIEANTDGKAMNEWNGMRKTAKTNLINSEMYELKIGKLKCVWKDECDTVKKNPIAGRTHNLKYSKIWQFANYLLVMVCLVT